MRAVTSTVATSALLALGLLTRSIRAGVPVPRRAQPPPRGGKVPRASNPPRIIVKGGRRYGRDETDALIADAAMRRAMPEADGGSPTRLDEWLPTVSDGDQFAGKVRAVCGYGCFVELIPESAKDPRDPDVFLQQGFDRPWRPIGLLHISSLSAERVSDVEAFTKAVVGPAGTRVVVSLKSTVFNSKKRISLDLVEVLQREDAWDGPVRKNQPLSAASADAADAGAQPSAAAATRAAADWVSAARARQLLSPTCRIGTNSAQRSVVWRLDREKRGVGSLPVGAALDAADAEDRANGPAEGRDRRKAVIYRNY